MRIKPNKISCYHLPFLQYSPLQIQHPQRSDLIIKPFQYGSFT